MPDKKNPLLGKQVMSVDPGLGGTGVVVWDPVDATKSTCFEPDFQKVIHSKTKVRLWTVRALEIVTEFQNIILDHMPNLILIEDQAMWMDSAAGLASSQRGDIVKLAHLVGMMMWECEVQAIDYELVSVRDWKGQLPKKAVDTRMKRLMGKTFPNHIADAVGIGLYKMGLF